MAIAPISFVTIIVVSAVAALLPKTPNIPMFAITPLGNGKERERWGLHHRRRHCGRGFNLLASEKAKRHHASDRSRCE
jgi:hypothetical protein